MYKRILVPLDGSARAEIVVMHPSIVSRISFTQGTQIDFRTMSDRAESKDIKYLPLDAQFLEPAVNLAIAGTMHD